MSRFLTIIACMLLSLSSIVAQDNYKTVKGYVVDKNGNPIPGAEVMAPGGGESVITDSDGSFKLNVHPLLKKLSATYDGMTTKTQKINFDSDMIFHLKQERKHSGFINLILSGGTPLLPGQLESFRGGSGIMGGTLGKWGFYGKIMAEGFANYGGVYPSITVGVVKSIYKRNSFFYFGAGYGSYLDKDYYDWGEHYYEHACAIDLGFIFKTSNHFNISAGTSMQTEFSEFFSIGLQIGVGYVF